jgi:hypothetical protein
MYLFVLVIVALLAYQMTKKKGLLQKVVDLSSCRVLALICFGLMMNESLMLQGLEALLI